MNFTEIVAEVVAATKRPDKILTARREVNMAVNFFSVNQNFSRDLFEQLLSITSTEYTQTLAFTSLARFRKVKYIKRGGTREYLKLLTASDLGTKCDNQDRYYLAGAGINISMLKLAATVDIGFYQYPPVLTDAAPTFWLLEQGWPMVFNRAVAKVFADIGDDASAKVHEGYARVDYASFCDDVPKDLG
jgi:hypothetical protein